MSESQYADVMRRLAEVERKLKWIIDRLAEQTGRSYEHPVYKAETTDVGAFCDD